MKKMGGKQGKMEENNLELKVTERERQKIVRK